MFPALYIVVGVKDIDIAPGELVARRDLCPDAAIHSFECSSSSYSISTCDKGESVISAVASSCISM